METKLTSPGVNRKGTPRGHYIIRGGVAGRERLRVLSRVMAPATTGLLARIGISEGARCLDAGCGNSDVTLELARLAGQRGQVTGIDLDEITLAIARDEARRTGVSNVTYLHAGLDDLDEHSAFDVAYARFPRRADPAGPGPDPHHGRPDHHHRAPARRAEIRLPPTRGARRRASMRSTARASSPLSADALHHLPSGRAPQRRTGSRVWAPRERRQVTYGYIPASARAGPRRTPAGTVLLVLPPVLSAPRSAAPPAAAPGAGFRLAGRPPWGGDAGACQGP